MFVIYVNLFISILFYRLTHIFGVYSTGFFLSVFMLSQCNMIMKLCKFFYDLTLLNLIHSFVSVIIDSLSVK